MTEIRRVEGQPWITNEHGQILCPMPHCAEPLFAKITSYIEMTLTSPGGEDVVPPSQADAQGRNWVVECLNDHIILVPRGVRAENGEPVDWNEDYFYDEDNDEDIPVDDGARLKGLFYTLTP